jgi:serine/threonine-protein kinase
MKRFLELSVNEALRGRASRLKEYAIGVEVFERPPHFDPSVDPIVRVEARRLRAKLEKYYATEGRLDTVIIELPKGGYAASFRKRVPGETSPGVETAKKTIAVLPFLALGQTVEAQQVSQGLTWELTHRLTRIEGLTVIASSSAAQLGTVATDISSLGEALKVATVLTGSVRQSGERIRIVAQLVATGTGAYLWSETYDRELRDLFAIQDDIAHNIVSHLRVRLAPGTEPRRRPRSYNQEAYQLYLRGRAEWNYRTEAGVRRALELFKEATAIDGDFALAYAGMADAYTLLAEYALEPVERVMPSAKAAASRALEVDPTLGEAHCSLAFQTALYEWKWDEAEIQYRHALDLNPGYATAHHWFACDLLALVGRFGEARDEVNIAVQLDPLSPIIAEGAAFTLLVSRQFEQAVAALEALIRKYPSFNKAHASLGRALIQLGRYDEAISCLRKAQDLGVNSPTVFGALGQAFGLSGREAEARQVLSRLEQERRQRIVPSTCFALTHAGLGENAQALDWLERGVDRRETPMTGIGVHPAYDNLRGEPRFAALLVRLDLPDAAVEPGQHGTAG